MGSNKHGSSRYHLQCAGFWPRRCASWLGNVSVVVGACSTGSANTPVLTSSAATIAATFGFGPAVELARTSARSGQNVMLIRAAQNAAGKVQAAPLHVGSGNGQSRFPGRRTTTTNSRSRCLLPEQSALRRPSWLHSRSMLGARRFKPYSWIGDDYHSSGRPKLVQHGSYSDPVRDVRRWRHLSLVLAARLSAARQMWRRAGYDRHESNGNPIRICDGPDWRFTTAGTPIDNPGSGIGGTVAGLDANCTTLLGQKRFIRLLAAGSDVFLAEPRPRPNSSGSRG